MSTRTFRDAEGTEWNAWQVLPGQQLETRITAGGLLPEGMGDGWVTFESATEKRRLYPIPQGWEDYPPEQLDSLCRAAHPVRAERLPSPS